MLQGLTGVGPPETPLTVADHFEREVSWDKENPGRGDSVLGQRWMRMPGLKKGKLRLRPGSPARPLPTPSLSFLGWLRSPSRSRSKGGAETGAGVHVRSGWRPADSRT